MLLIYVRNFAIFRHIKNAYIQLKELFITHINFDKRVHKKNSNVKLFLKMELEWVIMPRTHIIRNHGGIREIAATFSGQKVYFFHL